MRLQKSMILDLTERRCPSQESSFRIQFFLFEFNYLNLYISFDCSLFITFLWLHFMLSPYLQCSPLTPFVNYTLALSVKDTMVLTFLFPWYSWHLRTSSASASAWIADGNLLWQSEIFILSNENHIIHASEHQYSRCTRWYKEITSGCFGVMDRWSNKDALCIDYDVTHLIPT